MAAAADPGQSAQVGAAAAASAVTEADRVRAMLRACVDPPRPHRPLHQRRLEAGVTQQELADAAGVSRWTVSRLERGESLSQASGLVEAALRQLTAE